MPCARSVAVVALGVLITLGQAVQADRVSGIDEETSARTELSSRGVSTDRLALAAALASGDAGIRRLAARATAELRIVDLSAELVAALSDADPVVRYEAAIALTKFGRAEGKSYLRQELQTLEPIERALGAAGALAQAGDASGMPVVERALASDQVHVRLRATAELMMFAQAKALQAVERSRAAEFLAASLERETNSAVRTNVLLALGKIGNPSGLVAIQRALADPDPGVRGAAQVAERMLGVKR